MIAESNPLNLASTLFEVTGYFVGGGSISMSAPVNSATWSTMVFDSSWTDLERITLDGLDE